LASIQIHRTRLNRESQMPPYGNLRPMVGPHYRIANLVEKRRDVLRLARSLPRGPKRNQLRQTAASLRTLLRNKGWLDACTDG